MVLGVDQFDSVTINEPEGTQSSKEQNFKSSFPSLKQQNNKYQDSFSQAHFKVTNALSKKSTIKPKREHLSNST